MVAHQARTRNSSSLFIFLICGLSLLMVAVIWARLIGQSNAATPKPTFQTYRNAKYHFAISYPQSWQLQTAPDDGNVVTLSSFAMQAAGKGGNLQVANTGLPLNMSKIDILAYDVDAGTTAQDLMKLQTSGVTLKSSNVSSFKLDGQDALKVAVPTATNLLNGNESSPTYTTIFVTNGTRGYILAGYAEAALFNQIINSFQVN